VAARKAGGVTETGGEERLEAKVKGVVQGVGFRWFVVRSASELGLTGWPSNEADGSVHVVAEGARHALQELERLLRDGPPGAAVSEVEVTRGPGTREFSSFGIRAGAHRGD
jgi:acylphosphatase